jgi:dihydroorotase
MFDLVVSGGRLIDPSQNLDTNADVGIRGQRIAAIGTDLVSSGARAEIDARGLLVTPGWVDLHTHVYWGGAPLGIEPDPYCLYRGVTTAVDAGTAGASTFSGFKRYVIDVSDTRILAMLNISIIGMTPDDGGQTEAIGELEDIRLAAVDRAIEVARDYSELITGIKVRLGIAMTGPDPARALEALRRARRAADAIGKPVMVHIGSSAIGIDEILGHLVRGDIVTHVYHGHAEGVLDNERKVRSSVRDALDRGVNFDVGHGRGSFNWAVARASLDQGLLPGTISSDIHVWNVAGPVYDLATTASKLLHLGVSLPDVVRRVTATPAACIGMAGLLGTLTPGAAADVSIFRIAEGEWSLRDSSLVEETGLIRLVPVAVVRAGQFINLEPTERITGAFSLRASRQKMG